RDLRGPRGERIGRARDHRPGRRPGPRRALSGKPMSALIDMKDYNAPTKLYWWTVVALGTIALAYAVTGVMLLEPALMLQVVVGAVVAAIVGLFPVRIPGSKTSIAGAELFILLLLLVYGAPAP